MTDVARRDETPVPYDRNVETFSDLLFTADEAEGRELVKDERTDELAGPTNDKGRRGPGVPFVITRLTFRKGLPDPKVKGRYFAYVSCEAVVADVPYLESRKLSLDWSHFRPGDHIVFNDGSTGIYRQVVEYLATKQYITLPEGPAGGPKGESRYDLPPGEWVDVNVGALSRGEVGSVDEGFDTYQVDVRLFCPRGLRLSDYESEFGEATTRYIA